MKAFTAIILLLVACSTFAAEPKPFLGNIPSCNVYTGWFIIGPLNTSLPTPEVSRAYLKAADCKNKREVIFQCHVDASAQELTFEDYLNRRLELEKECNGSPVV